MVLSMGKDYTNSYSPVNANLHSTTDYVQSHNPVMEMKDWLALQIEELGTNPTDIARESDGALNQPTVARVLSGETPNPRLKTVNAIKSALDKIRASKGIAATPGASEQKNTSEQAEREIDLDQISFRKKDKFDSLPVDIQAMADLLKLLPIETRAAFRFEITKNAMPLIPENAQIEQAVMRLLKLP